MYSSNHFHFVFIFIVSQIMQVSGSAALANERTNISTTDYQAHDQFNLIIGDPIHQQLRKGIIFAEKYLKSKEDRAYLHSIHVESFGFLQILYGLISGEKALTKLFLLYGPHFKEHHISDLNKLKSKFNFDAKELGIALHNYVEWNVDDISKGSHVLSSVLASISSDYSVTRILSEQYDFKTLSWLLKFKPAVETLHPEVFENSWNSGNTEVVSIILQNGGIKNPEIARTVENLSMNVSFVKVLVKNEIVDSIVHLMSKNLFDIVDVVGAIIDENKIGLLDAFFNSNSTGSDEETLRKYLNMPIIDGEITLLFKAIDNRNVYAKNIFLNAGADVNAVINCNKTLLHVAVERNKVHVARELIELGANINTKDCKFLSPIEKAIALKKMEIVKLLLDNADDDKKINLLYTYLERNNTEQIEIMLKVGTNIDSRLGCNETLLHKAVTQNKPYIVNSLIKNGAHIYAKECHSRTAMHLAIQLGNRNIIRTLAIRGFDVNKMFDDGKTPLSFAATNASMEVIETLISEGAKLDYDEMNSTTPLFEALRWNRTNVVQYFLNNGANLNIKFRNEDTYLHRAVQIGSPGLVEELVKLGIQIDSINANNETALAKAIQRNQHVLVNVLAKNGANLTHLLPNGESYLHLAVHSRAVQALQALLSQGMKPDIRINVGDTPMWIAVKKDDIEALTVLKSLGADVHQRNRWAYTLFHEAAYSNSLKALAWLADNGLSVNVTDSLTKTTPLHLAAYTGSRRAVETLLSRNPCVNCKDTDGCTPLFVAEYYHYTEVAELIKLSGGKT